MSGEEKEYLVKVTRLGGYKFEIDFGLSNADKIIVDEDPPLGNNEGGDPSRLLAASMAHCTMSSLLFCMQKSRAEVDEMNGTARIKFGRDERKRLRIVGMELMIVVKVSQSDRAKLQRCIPLFQDFCTVTKSVERGIPVTTEIKFMDEEDTR